MILHTLIFLSKKISGRQFHFLLVILLSLPFTSPSPPSDTLLKGSSLPTNASLISQGGLFKLSFFLGGPSRGYYLAISYNNISINTIVWVANRDTPADEASSLQIGHDNLLQVVSGKGEILWSSNSTLDYSNSSTQILDNGNLILTSKNDQKTILWQSFHHPTDTFLPGMELTMDPSTGETRKLVSWNSPEDPSPGRFSLSLDPKGSGQLFMWNGSDIWWRSGQWNKKSFIGLTRMKALSIYGFSLVVQDGGKMVLSFNYLNPFLRFVMQWDGIENTSLWTPENNSWTGVWLQPLTNCETYNFCGNYSLCEDGGLTKCGCVLGFSPRIEGEERSECVRKTPLICGENSGDGEVGYARIEGVKVPDFSEWASSAGDEVACGSFCSANCSCKAYSYVEDVGCLIWAVDLVDLAKLATNGKTLFLKLDSRDLDVGGGEKNTKKVLSIVLPIVFAFILFLSIYFGWKYKAKREAGWKEKENGMLGSSIVQPSSNGDGQTQSSKQSQAQSEDSLDLPLYNFDDIAAATDSFSNNNKLGQGGFGVVHKGVLPSGEVIAVKRLAKNSCQGIEELRNEVRLIANLQHRNLVKLLGYCFEGDEKILVYEYMPNKSLDFLLFDPERQSQLDWRKRFDIIEGIARGLVYLHRDSRLLIVHRDLKASNILLDEDMNPKISDFGMARIFGGNQINDNTNRVVGTFGYMSPEYAMEGLFSAKSDVYSFGVLLLEIVSGKKNARTRSESYTNLIGYAWQLWVDGRPEDLIDQSIRKSCDVPQAVRCIHIGLLCVQNLTRDRPTMATVVILLSSQNPIQQSPKKPTFLLDSSRNDTIVQKLNEDRFSINDVTITTITGR